MTIHPMLWLATLLILPMVATAEDIAVRGDLIYTMESDPIENGVVIVEDGRISRIGRADRIRIPDGMTVLDAAVVTPGFVDAHSTVGLSGVYGGRAGQVRDQDQLETSDPVQPELRPIDAYNTADPLIAWIRQFGVTTIHTGHGPGAVVSGRTMIVKTRGRTAEEALVSEDTAIAITLGPSVTANFESPGTRAKTVALLRSAFIEAADYAAKQGSDEPPPRDLKLEVLSKVLDGEIRAMVTAQNSIDIATALRLRDEFDLNMLLDGAADAHLMTDTLLEADIPILLHPPMMRASGERQNASFEAAARLQAAGIPYAIQTGHEGYVPKSRILLFETAIAVANGLGTSDAIASVTRTPAELLGIDERVGSLARGKDGDLVLFNGDPFEYTTQVCVVIIEGEPVSETCW